MESLYDIAVFILGDLPHQFQFAYIILTIVLCILVVLCVFAPFIIAYKWFSK